MNPILLIFILLLALILTLVSGGVILATRRKFKTRGGKRYAKLAATLVVAVGYWLTQTARAGIDLSIFELVLSLAVLWAVSYYVLWAGIGLSHGDSIVATDMQDSSVLSMLYTRMDGDVDFPPTIMMTAESTKTDKGAPEIANKTNVRAD